VAHPDDGLRSDGRDSFLHDELFVDEEPFVDAGVRVVPLSVPQDVAAVGDQDGSRPEAAHRVRGKGGEGVPLLDELLTVPLDQGGRRRVAIQEPADDVVPVVAQVDLGRGEPEPVSADDRRSVALLCEQDHIEVDRVVETSRPRQVGDEEGVAQVVEGEVVGTGLEVVDVARLAGQEVLLLGHHPLGDDGPGRVEGHQDEGPVDGRSDDGIVDAGHQEHLVEVVDPRVEEADVRRPGRELRCRGEVALLDHQGRVPVDTAVVAAARRAIEKEVPPAVPEPVEVDRVEGIQGGPRRQREGLALAQVERAVPEDDRIGVRIGMIGIRFHEPGPVVIDGEVLDARHGADAGDGISLLHEGRGILGRDRAAQEREERDREEDTKFGKAARHVEVSGWKSVRGPLCRGDASSSTRRAVREHGDAEVRLDFLGFGGWPPREAVLVGTRCLVR